MTSHICKSCRRLIEFLFPPHAIAHTQKKKSGRPQFSQYFLWPVWSEKDSKKKAQTLPSPNYGRNKSFRTFFLLHRVASRKELHSSCRRSRHVFQENFPKGKTWKCSRKKRKRRLRNRKWSALLSPSFSPGEKLSYRHFQHCTHLLLLVRFTSQVCKREGGQTHTHTQTLQTLQERCLLRRKMPPSTKYPARRNLERGAKIIFCLNIISLSLSLSSGSASLPKWRGRKEAKH